MSDMVIYRFGMAIRGRTVVYADNSDQSVEDLCKSLELDIQSDSCDMTCSITNLKDVSPAVKDCAMLMFCMADAIMISDPNDSEVHLYKLFNTINIADIIRVFMVFNDSKKIPSPSEMSIKLESALKTLNLYVPCNKRTRDDTDSSLEQPCIKKVSTVKVSRTVVAASSSEASETTLLESLTAKSV
jgi:hypothetical protein